MAGMIEGMIKQHMPNYGKELKPRIKENGIDYILVGDYYIPEMVI